MHTTLQHEIEQAHCEALQVLRDLLKETAHPAEDLDDDGNPTPKSRANARRLSLRLRAATAILRVKLPRQIDTSPPRTSPGNTRSATDPATPPQDPHPQSTESPHALLSPETLRANWNPPATHLPTSASTPPAPRPPRPAPTIQLTR